jgi:hypothetical protein
VKEQIRAEIASQPESPIYSVFSGRFKSGHAEPKRLKGRSRERAQKEGHPPILNRWPSAGIVYSNYRLDTAAFLRKTGLICVNPPSRRITLPSRLYSWSTAIRSGTWQEGTPTMRVAWNGNGPPQLGHGVQFHDDAELSEGYIGLRQGRTGRLGSLQPERE